jgi:hypothetical protein
LEGGRHHDRAQNTQETTNLHTMHKKYFNVPVMKIASYNVLDLWWMLHARVQMSALQRDHRVTLLLGDIMLLTFPYFIRKIFLLTTES